MVWVIGSNGMLGTELSRRLESASIPWIGTDKEVDITDINAIDDFIKNYETSSFLTSHSTGEDRIRIIVNCAAYTAVEKAEEDKDLAYKLNTVGPRNIARSARKASARLIHISTDYVFDGTASTPYTEDIIKKPLGVYGETKSLGEDEIQKEMTQYYILRTAWLYGHDRPNFVYTMTKLMNSHETLRVVNDQFGTPTYAGDLSNAIVKIIQMSEKAILKPVSTDYIPFGIYNFTNLGIISWYDFASKIYELGKKYKLITNECTVNPCSTEEYGAKVKRPAFSVLDKTKIQKTLKIKIPKWQLSLEKFMKDKRFSPEVTR